MPSQGASVANASHQGNNCPSLLEGGGGLGEQLREEKRDDCQINAIRLRDTYEVKSTILGTYLHYS